MNSIQKIAHRGYSEKYPENTMPAFEAAVKAGADMIELDVHLTRDGRVVVIHDDYIDRTSDGTGMIRNMLYRDLKQFSYHYTFSGYSRVDIPLLEDVLDLCRGECEVNIELKMLPVLYEGLTEAVAACVTKCNAADEVLISSFDHYSLLEFRERMSKIRTGMLFDSVWTLFCQEVQALNVYSVHPSTDALYPRHLDWCRKQSIPVYVWVAKNRSQIEYLASLNGISGIMVNDMSLFV